MRYTLYTTKSGHFFFKNNASRLVYRKAKSLTVAYDFVFAGATTGMNMPKDVDKALTQINSLNQLQESYPEYFI